jgi:hypothetical protein
MSLIFVTLRCRSEAKASKGGGKESKPSLRAQRSNPSRPQEERMDCFPALAMTISEVKELRAEEF